MVELTQVEVDSEQEFVMVFEDRDGDPSDPTTITLTIYAPDETSTVINKGDMTSPLTGTWIATFTPDQFGRYYYKIQSTGNPKLVNRDTFDTAFDEPV